MEFSSLNIQDLQLDHSIDVTPSTGSSSIGVSIPLTETRVGFNPALSLQYNSSSINSIFGIGWSLSGLSFIGIDTSEKLPKYDGTDTFAFNGSIPIVPYLEKKGSIWEQRVEEINNHWVYYYRSKLEEEFTRFERWEEKGSGMVHWRTRSKTNIISIYGLDPQKSTRIYDPENPNREFMWLLEAQYDEFGNAIFYIYDSEDSLVPDDQQAFDSFEINRFRKFVNSGYSQKYPKKIIYGNTKPLKPDMSMPNLNKWLFEIVFDYGDYPQKPYTNNQPTAIWEKRKDPFSIYNAGFEIRTYRLCRRILMYHNFDELSASISLVGMLKFNFDEMETGTTLKSIGYSGVRKDLKTGIYSEKTLPDLDFNYTLPVLNHTFEGIVKETNNNFPQGFNSSSIQLVDLLGEGIPGILTETNSAWYYKSNLGNGVFGKQETVINKPSQLTDSFALGDFDQNGNLNYFSFNGQTAGFYEYNCELEKWSGFTAFKNIPKVSHAQFLDVNADGLPDLVIEKEDKIICYPFKGKDGFEKPYEFSKPVSDLSTYAPTIGKNFALDYFMADMTGDGLADQVKITNGRIEYFPNFGNGHFGEAVVMENPPNIDFENTYDASRIRLYDLDGSGTSDIIYIGNGEILYWYNASGNKFIEGGRITNLPYIDNISSAIILDFLNNGTPCLVWSNSLNHLQYSTIQYLKLTNGIKPRLLTSFSNSMGKEVKFVYNSSAFHYLRDKNSSSPWISKIPSHFTVVDSKEIIDHISNTRFVTQYKYKDGHYDGQKRKFVTFGLVEQYDAEFFIGDDSIDDEDYAQPVCSKTWFHPGIFENEIRRTRQFYNKDLKHSFLEYKSFENAAAMELGEFESAYRTLAGRVIRQELFSITDGGKLESHPVRVSQSSYKIRKLQPKINNHGPSFLTYQSEAVEHEYEQIPDDPKISHHLTISVNKYGDPEKEMTISYARRSAIANTHPSQQKDYITASEHNYINTDRTDKYETGILFEWKDFEINHINRPEDGLIKLSDVHSSFENLIDNAIDFDKPLHIGGPEQARLISWDKSFFWNNDFTDAMDFGELGIVTLSHHEQSACFNNEIILEAYGGKVPVGMLGDQAEGNYLQRDGYLWKKTEINHFLGAEKFFNLAKVEAVNGSKTEYTYDNYHLNIIKIKDPLENITTGVIDYNLVEPFRLIDQNDNVSEVLYDALGVATASFSLGAILDENNAPQKYGNGILSEYIIKNDADIANIIATPKKYLQQADSFLFYDFDSGFNDNKPLRSISLNRENLIHDGTGKITLNTSVQMEIFYIDGFGRTLQSKQKVEAGLAIKRKSDGGVVLDAAGMPVQEMTEERWLVSGHVTYNNKQQPIRQFEPFFSSLVRFETDQALQNYGVSAHTHYDAVGREFRTDFPNGTFTEVIITPWKIQFFDQNDTVDRSFYKIVRETLPLANLEKIALNKTLSHKNTPSVSELDPIGREILKIQINNDGTERRIENVYDISGNILKIIDARMLTAFTYKRDMLGRTLYENSVDAGEIWSFYNSSDQVIHLWDSRNIHQTSRYDDLDRVTSVQVNGALNFSQITERFIYGEDNSLNNRKEKNLKGHLVKHYDQAGTLEVYRYTPAGIPMKTDRKLLKQFTKEPDWTDLSADILENHNYRSSAIYDALGRIRQQQLPDQTTRIYVYHQGGGIQKIILSTADGVLSDVEILKDSAYDAKSMRQRALLGNDVETNYSYNAETFTMTHLHSSKTIGGQRTYQDIDYTYDPVGNLVHLVDNAQQAGNVNSHVIQGLNVSAHSEYVYDALYQLKSAKGRVHQALLKNDHRDRSRENGVPANWIKGTRHITLNNGAAVERYSREYDYDVAGNIKFIKHIGASQNWTKQIWTSANSNRSLPLNDLNGNQLVNPETHFDQNGNCTFMPHVDSVDWNYRNNISKAIIIDRSAQNKPDDVEYYVYGGDGIRVRKITQTLVDLAAETIKLTEKIYLDGCEIKRVMLGGQEILKRVTSHISDGNNNIALIHAWEKDSNALETDDIATKKIHYQLTDHLDSASLELDEDGDVITYEEYFPFGGSSFIAGKNKRDIALKDYRYSGKERDDFTGLYYFGYRYYAHWIGGWFSPDPIGPEDSENLYLYVQNNPINLVDPNGLKSSKRKPKKQKRGKTVVASNAMERQISKYRESLTGDDKTNEQTGKLQILCESGGECILDTPENIKKVKKQQINIGNDFEEVRNTNSSDLGDGDGGGDGDENIGEDRNVTSEGAGDGENTEPDNARPGNGGSDENPDDVSGADTDVGSNNPEASGEGKGESGNGSGGSGDEKGTGSGGETSGLGGSSSSGSGANDGTGDQPGDGGGTNTDELAWWEKGLAAVGGVIVGFVKGAVDMVKGLYNMVRHPIQTIKGIYDAVTHPIRTAKAIGKSIKNTVKAIASGDAEAIGRAIFEIASAFVPVSKLGKVSKVADVADTVADVAKVSNKVSVGARASNKVSDVARVSDDISDVSKASNKASNAKSPSKPNQSGDFPDLETRFSHYKKWKENAGIEGKPTSEQFRRYKGAHTPDANGVTLYPKRHTIPFPDGKRAKLYRKRVHGTDQHGKYGKANNIDTRYKASERPDMEQLWEASEIEIFAAERWLHKNLSLGPLEGQKYHFNSNKLDWPPPMGVNLPAPRSVLEKIIVDHKNNFFPANATDFLSDKKWLSLPSNNTDWVLHGDWNLN